MGLKELQAWRLVQLRHQPGDRREYFQAPQDVWEIFKRLAEERRRREIEPTQSMLRAAMMEEASTEEERYAQQRMRDMHELIDKLMNWFDDVQRLSPETAMQLMGMGSAVTRLLDIKDKITGRRKQPPKLEQPSGLNTCGQVTRSGTGSWHQPESQVHTRFLHGLAIQQLQQHVRGPLPTSSLGVRMVVSGGTIWSLPGRSLKPAMATCSGTLMPMRAASSSAPVQCHRCRRRWHPPPVRT